MPGPVGLSAEDVTDLEREAAVVAMGITRDEAWIELLTEIKGDEAEPEPLRKAAESSLAVIGGEPYDRLREALMRAGSDEIPRDRLFPEVIVRGRR